MQRTGFLRAIVACALSVAIVNVAGAARELDKGLNWPGETLNGNPCYGKPQGFGPYDYTNRENVTEGRVALVENTHFRPEYEGYLGAASVGAPNDLEGTLGYEFDYTLRSFPNHHRALWARVRLYFLNPSNLSASEREKRERARKPWPPPECYLHRARAFAPEDPVPTMIFGTYLHRLGKLEEAMKMYLEVKNKLSNSAEFAYNMGLLSYDLGDYIGAQRYADKAKELGYPLNGLERKLRERTSK